MKSANKKLILLSLIPLSIGAVLTVFLLTNSRQSENLETSVKKDSMAGMNTEISQINYEAKLKIDGEIIPNQKVPMAINIQDKQGNPVPDFDTFQEKLMHLIAVSDDLEFFEHIHPVYQGNGRFEFNINFPKSGSYSLFSDYKPSGAKEVVSVIKTQVPGDNSKSVADINFDLTKLVEDTKVNMSFLEPKVEPNKELTVTFDLRQPQNDKPIQDLQPYLGERGHLVILKQSPSLSSKDYIHAHAMKNSPNGLVQFMAVFPQTGKYKLWGQFNRNGKIVVSDFWVDVNQ